MAEPKKRPATTDSDGPQKKPKFEKNAFRRTPGKNPFNKPAGKGFQNGKKFDSKFGKKPAGQFQKKFEKKEDGEQQPQQQKQNEKPDWNKMKKDKKELKLKRKAQDNDLFELTKEAKQIYEKLKSKACPNKAELSTELHRLIGNIENYKKLVTAHDTARIVQCMLKHSSPEIQRQIADALIPIVPIMVPLKYAHFCVLRMLQHGANEIKQKIIEKLLGNVVKFLRQEHAAAVIDLAYVTWANAQQKAFMRQELYGDLFKDSKDSKIKCIADVYKDSEIMKPATLSAVKANLNHFANKKLIDNSVIHAVLLDFLQQSNEEDRTEIMTAYLPYIPSLASTKDGVRAAMHIFYNSIVKDRRAIVKTIREHLVRLCTHEHGHILVIAIVNCMDDTKALKKAIFDAIFPEIENIVASQWGRKVIEWFVSPASRTAFHPQLIEFLEEGLKYGKKDKETRRTELLEAVEEPICTSIAENASLWLRGGPTALTTAEVLSAFKGENLKKAFNRIAELICDVDWQIPLKEVEAEGDNSAKKIVIKIENDEEESAPKKIKKKKVFAGNFEKEDKKPISELVRGVEHAGMHIALKKIVKLGKDVEGSVKFSSSLVEKLNDEVITQWLPLNRAGFLLLEAYQNSDEDAKNSLKELLTKHKAVLKKQKHAASRLLCENLNIK